MEKLRTQKIYSKYRSRTHDNTTIPEIRLEGKWLDKLGFKEGRQIIIQQEQNKLTITLLEVPDR
jgi:toxic protein SymE